MRFLVAFVFLICAAVAQAGEAVPFFQPLVPPRAFQVMVHRGLARLAPENSRRAIDLCVEDGLEWVEVDVRLSADGQHVLFHDAELDAKSDGQGPLKERSLEALKQLDAGGWFARRFKGTKLLILDECLAHVKGRINLYLDCKDVNPDLLVEQIKRAGVERQVIVFGNRELLARVRQSSGGAVAVMPKWHPGDGFGAWLTDLAPAAVEVDADEITSDICRQFHARGIKVQAKVLGPWDQPKTWDKVLSDGVDYLQTDLPEEIVAHVLDQQLKPRPVRMACHRGASRYAPENTLPAFEKAYRLHADFVEFDVRPSRDGKFFLLHDGKLDRTTNGHGPIREADNALVEGLDAGGWFGKPFANTPVPSLDDFLSAVPPDVSLYFDAKDIPPEALAEALARHRLSERSVVYQSASYLERLKQVDSRLRAMPGAKSQEEVTRLAAGLKPYAVDTPWPALSKAYIDHCHAAGIQVFADAPPFVDVKGYRRAIELGIDLIQTDYPLRLLRAMELVAADRGRP